MSPASPHALTDQDFLARLNAQLARAPAHRVAAAEALAVGALVRLSARGGRTSAGVLTTAEFRVAREPPVVCQLAGGVGGWAAHCNQGCVGAPCTHELALLLAVVSVLFPDSSASLADAGFEPPAGMEASLRVAVGTRAAKEAQADEPADGWWWAWADMQPGALAAGAMHRAVAHAPGEVTYPERIVGPHPVGMLRAYVRALEREPWLFRRVVRPDPALVAFLASPEAAAREQAWTAWLATERITTWLRTTDHVEPPLAPCGVRAELRLLPADLPGLHTLAVRVFTTGRRGEEPRASQHLSTLHREVVGGVRRVPPVEEELLAFLGRTSAVARGGDVFPAGRLKGWAETFGRHGRLTWEDGTAVQVEVDVVEHLVLLRSGTDAHFHVMTDQAGAVPVPLDGAVLVVDDSYEGLRPFAWRRDGPVLRRLVTHGTPFPVLGALAVQPRLSLATLGDAEGSATLRRYLPRQLPAGFVPLHTEVPVAATVELVLEGSRLSVRGRAEGGGHVFHLALPPAWLPAATTRAPAPDTEALEAVGDPAAGLDPAAQPRHPGGVVYLPRAEDLQALDAWLARVPRSGAWVGGPGGGFHVGLAKSARDELLEWWAHRPAGPGYLGNPAFKRLVDLWRPPGFRFRVQSSGVDWVKVDVETEAAIASLDLGELQQALRASQARLVPLRGGRTAERAELEAFTATLGAVLDMGLLAGAEGQRLHALQLARAPAAALEALRDVDGAGALQDAVRAAVDGFKGIPRAVVPSPAAEALRPYQREGVDFLLWAARTFGGALLADDMGLGKTLQVLAALAALHPPGRRKRTVAPSLVVCPASVVHGWEREAARFTPQLRVVTLGRGARRKEQLADAGKADLFLTNYALLRRDREDLGAMEWNALVVDEAQAIKNAASDTARALKSLRAKVRIALTGTPIENRLEDLVSIMEFAVPGYLPAATGDSPSALRALRARLRPVMIRRTKREVAPELPDRIEERLDCPMTPAQRTAYLRELKVVRDSLARTRGELAGPARIEFLAGLMRLRQVACDPGLLGLVDAGSGKMEEVLGLLDTLLGEGNKVLLFSQFVTMLERIQARLVERGIKHRVLTGQTRDRQALVEGFAADAEPQVFLISLKAGGAGLNLQSAAHVILFDPWWNPAAEAQAIDRTHRIGQDRTVMAFRMVTEGTVEERILELQQTKKALAAGVLGEEDAFTGKLTRADFEYLLDEP
ncbi:MAG: DEAD/DEAH box helicase [Deltaproteobacteria bacterium]|nr:DEAD/DEAH box helicase [Deltaproteobacteria bacterium]